PLFDERDKMRLPSFLQRVSSRLFTGKRPEKQLRKRPRHGPVRLQVEQLEDRVTPAVTHTAWLGENSFADSGHTSISLDVTVAAGQSIMGELAIGNGQGGTLTGVTDSAGNNYTINESALSTSQNVYIFSSLNIANALSGGTIIASFGAIKVQVAL